TIKLASSASRRERKVILAPCQVPFCAIVEVPLLRGSCSRFFEEQAVSRVPECRCVPNCLMNGKHLPLRWNHARAAVESFCWLEMVDDDRPNVALQPSCREALKQPWSDEQNIERSLRKEFGRTIRVARDVEALAVPLDE